MERLIIDTPADVEIVLGRDLGPSPWLTVEQARLDAFADATGDHQWIHVDVEQARTSEYGGTIAHANLLLGMAPVMLREVLDLRGVTTSVNYGCDRIRFLAPVRAGSRIRLRPRLTAITHRKDGHRVSLSYQFEREGCDRLACVADCISLWRFR
jgi:acyl dehydratase